MPELSVLMGTYNEKKIQAARAIDSILGQTFTDFEFLICDDGSEQAFFQWLSAYCKKDKRIRLFRNAGNRGLAAVLNRCLSLASGRLIARMDADDFAYPARFAKQLAFLRDHPDYAFVASSAYLMDEHGIWGIRRPVEVPQKEDFLHTSPFIHPSVIFRRKALLSVRGYCEADTVVRVEDYDLFMRMYAAGMKGYNLQEPLLAYREDRYAYGRRRYRYRLHECQVRRKGFQRLGILRKNLVYVAKPLAAGMVPGCMAKAFHRQTYGLTRRQKDVLQDSIQQGSIRIFVTHSPDSRHLRPKHPLFVHVAAGSVFWEQPVLRGMVKDSTGSHISGKNPSYCELTTQYWAWKNVRADVYGFCHYRRYFSFASGMLPSADCGFPVFPYLDAKSLRQLCMDEQTIRRKAGQYDFLIAKGIPVGPWAKNVYDNFKKAPQLHIEDLDLFLKIVCRRWPRLRTAVTNYMNGSVFYPFNMFLMKQELFEEYCTILFAALEEFERCADMSLYSREALRTPGHLAERFAGIYYVYLQQTGGYRLGELQTVLFEKTQQPALPGKTRQTDRSTKMADTAQTYGLDMQQEVLAVLAANRAYAPILFTCLKSLCSHVNPDRNYRIFILHTDMDPKTEQLFYRELCCGNIQIGFVDVGAKIAGYRLKGKGSITAETFYRFLIPDLFRNFPKAVYLDADTIVCEDIAKLYDIRLGECLLAAVPDIDVIGQYNGANPDTRRYQEETLRLDDPYGYVQAGVLLLNIPALRRTVSVRKLLAMARRREYRYADQDILNIVCQGRIRHLDMSWNVLTDSGPQRSAVIRYAPAYLQKAYEQARKSPRIIHYCGSPKPWEDPEQDFAGKFWKTARQTPYYEILQNRMAGQKRNGILLHAAVNTLRHTAKKILPQGSWLRRTVGMVYWKLK